MSRGIGPVIKTVALLVLVVIIAILLIDLVYPGVLRGVSKDMHYVQYTVLKLTGRVPELTVTAPKPAPLMIPSGVDVYVIGPSSLVNRLVFMGVPPQLMKQATPSQLSAIPSSSIIVIDWDYINKTLHIDYNQLSKLLEAPIGNGDLVIITTSNTSMRNILTLEDTVAVAWGNRWHAKVIGYPVIGVSNTSAVYVIGYGAKGLMIDVIPQYTYTTNSLNNVISGWARAQGIQITTSTQNPLTDPLYINWDPCEVIESTYGGKLNGQYGWFFLTGTRTLYDPEHLNAYVFDYCVLVLNVPVSSSNSIATNYYGYTYVEPSIGGSLDWYKFGINMTEAYSIDQSNGFNSYMGWGGEIDAAQPNSGGCPVTSHIEITIGILQQILFEALKGNNQVAGYNVAFSMVPSIVGYLNDLTWSVSTYGALCLPAPLTAGAQYPVGWEVDTADGLWFLRAGPGNVNTAASPILWSSISDCFGPYYTSTGSSYYVVSYYQSAVYFVLQYSPTGSGYTVTEQSTNHYWTPLAFDQTQQSCP